MPQGHLLVARRCTPRRSSPTERARADCRSPLPDIEPAGRTKAGDNRTDTRPPCEWRRAGCSVRIAWLPAHATRLHARPTRPSAAAARTGPTAHTPPRSGCRRRGRESPRRPPADGVLGRKAAHSNSKSLRAKPDCRMMLESVPNASSEWSGTGTVVVVLPDRCCMMM